jgi:hypothetical protein
MQSTSNEQTKGASYDFMLEEYRSLRERSQNMKDDAVVRLNFFIGLTSALVGGSLVLGNNATLSPILFKSLLLVELIILTIIGLDVFNSVVIRNQVIDKAERGMSRIRRYFIINDPSLAQFMTYRTSDEPTFWLTNRSGAGMRRTTQILIGFTSGLSIGILADLINILLEFEILIGVLSSIIVFFALELSARRSLNRALKDAEKEIKFKKEMKPESVKK